VRLRPSDTLSMMEFDCGATGRKRDLNIHFVAKLALGALAASSAAPAARPAPDATLHGDLVALSRMTVFFGHQSVGENILDGARQLAAEQGMTLRIAEVASAAHVPASTWGHAFIRENGNPDLKIESFVGAFSSMKGPGVDVAFMKFCYVDFQPGIQGGALFTRYRAAMVALRAAHPATTFVHVTAPLTFAEGGLKARVRRLLGRDTEADANLRRAEFNDLIREAYLGKEPLFDLARIESTGFDGSASLLEWRGRAVPRLAPTWTDDGAHLNVTGRHRVARELVSLLAGIQRSRGR
jgi:hypothetical protein